MHALDRILYLSGANAGHHVRSAADFIIGESRRHPVVLLLPPKPGNPSEGVAVYLRRQPNIRILTHPDWPREEVLLVRAYKASPYHSGADVPLDPDQQTIFWVYPFTEYPRARFEEKNPDFSPVWESGAGAQDRLLIYEHSPVR